MLHPFVEAARCAAAGLIAVACVFTDVRADVIRQARNDGWSFLDGVLNGIFTVPGDGDFDAVLATLHEAAYQGWLVVEAEQDPAVAPSYACAKKGYDTLRGSVSRHWVFKNDPAHEWMLQPGALDRFAMKR